MSNAFTYERRLRFEDVDLAHVLFYPRYFAICHEALEALLAEEIDGGYPAVFRDRGLALATVHAEANYESPIYWGDSVRVELTVEQLGTTSVALFFGLFRGSNGERAATVRQTHVLCTLSDFAKVELPTDLRDAFGDYLHHSTMDASDTIPPPAASEPRDTHV